MSFLGQEEQLREYQEKFRYIHAALFLFLGLLVARLVFLQIFSGDRMLRVSEDNRIRQVRIAATRGMIFDRNRVLLIDNQPSFDLEITPQYFRQSGKKGREETIKRLSGLVSMSEENIKKRLKAKSREAPFKPVKIKTELNRDEVAKVEAWKIDMPGVAVAMEIQRTNIFNDIASHLLGYIGRVTKREIPRLKKKYQRSYEEDDSVGKFGIELQLENLLQGRTGRKLVEVDVLGREIRQDDRRNRIIADTTRDRPAIPGKNLVLSIDQDLQLAAAQAFGDKVGGLVAMDPRNGEILAMISRPSFDPTEFSRGISSKKWRELLNNENRPLRDKTIQDHYSPGSVFKVITSIAGLESGVITANKSFPCPGRIKVGRRYYHCHKRAGHGWVNVKQALEMSCDVFFYRVAQKLKSVDEIAKWAKAFGLGQRTNIDLPREVPGLIPTEAWKKKRYGTEWNPGESLSVAIGQSFVLTTVLQVANLYAAIANGGKLYQPQFLKRIETFDGKEIKQPEPEMIRQATLSPETLSLIRKGLWRVVNSPKGTAFGIRLPGMNFAGKSGTVQVVRAKADEVYRKCSELPYRRRHNAVFAGYAPADDPVIAVAVLAEHECSGSAGAGPIVQHVIRTYLQKYDPEKYGEEALAEIIKKDKAAAVARWKARQARQNSSSNSGEEESPALITIDSESSTE